MRLVTITAETPAAALKKAQSDYGEDAIVINSKEIRKKTAFTPSIYEVTIAIEDDAGTKHDKKHESSEPHRAPEPKQLKKNPYLKNEDVSVELSNALKEITKIAGITEPARIIPPKPSEEPAQIQLREQKKSEPEPLREIKEPQRSANDELKELKQIKGELDKLNDKIKLIQHTLWDEKGPKKEGLIIPQEFAEIYSLAKNSGMVKDHIDKIMQLTLEHMPLRMRDNSILIRRYFRELLKKMILPRREIEIEGAKKIIMLVGPTGVGKTTTLAKLAARYAYLMDKKYKVGIITLDTYRIGAVQQLMFYAQKMKLSIDSVEDPPEFATAINSLRHCDYILIDTAGSSQYDRAKIDSLKSFLNAETTASIDVMLAVSANTKYEDLKEIYNGFAPLNVDTFVVTKLDESRSFGNIFSLLYETRKPVSYFSIGQNVPDDLIVASGEFLTTCLLDGFSKEALK